MKVKFFLAWHFLMFYGITIFSQNWIRTYESIEDAMGRACTEYYDKGFLIAGYVHIDEPTYVAYGWIQKTDVNGYELWRKTIKDSMKLAGLFDMRSLEDGGFIAIGSSIQSDLFHDPLVIKFNVCGEKEWCNLYNSPGNFDYGLDIEPVPGGGYMALMNYWGYDKNKRIWLFRLDDSGSIVWQQAYALDTLFYNEEAVGICRATDTSIIITGYTYWPDSIPPHYYFLTPLLIEVNYNGVAEWELPWGETSEFIGSGNQSISSDNQEIYTVVQHSRSSYPFGTSPTLIKTNNDGVPIGFHNIIDLTNNANATTINWFQDSSLAIGAGWQLIGASEPDIGVFKVDTSGTLLQEKVLLTSHEQVPNDAYVTQDNKLFLITSVFVVEDWKWKVYAFKLNADLEYDSIYTAPFNYDSLCPYPIVSDTIPLDDCEVIVDIDDPIEHPEKSRLKVYPNPAQEKIAVEMPEYLVRKSEGDRISTTTYYHQWSRVQLEVFDLFGRLMFVKEIPQQENRVEIDVSSWPAGMYVARIVFMNEVVGSVKFVVN